jgi:hypothetical protein
VFTKIISGGQTGVDRAALDVALKLGVPCGGWCPKGRRTADGRLPAKYPLDETASASYPERTRLNVQDADGTLVLTHGTPKGGTALTIGLARKLKKPHLTLDLRQEPDPHAVIDWAKEKRIRILNIAGPRETESHGIYSLAVSFLEKLLG